MKRFVIPILAVSLMVGAAFALVLTPSQAQEKTPAQTQMTPSARQGDLWSRLSFLIGEWQGVGSGAPGEAAGGTSFAFGLDKNILVRKNWAEYPPKAGETTGLSHEDMMIIHPAAAGAPFRAVYFDNEGHVIHYLVTFPDAGRSLVFETDPAQPGPRFRLTYELKENGVLDNVFWVAPPGGEFKVYVQGSLKKK